MTELSLLVPLEDARGDAVEHLRTWTHEQSLPRERYQVVIASTGEDPEGDERVQDLLADHDVFERVPGADLIELWNAAAARADSDWVVLTENHCEADPACLASVVRTIESDGDHDALTLDHGHITSNAVSELGARWFEQVYEEWDEPGQWPRLNLVGFAIRRGAYLEAGGLDPRYGLFSAPLLSARLHRGGARIGHLPDAHVLHVHADDIEEHHGHSADFARGECEARTREERVFCERYFGPAPIWTNRLRYEPRFARRAGAVIAASAARAVAGRRGELPWLLRELAAWLPAAVGRPGSLSRAREAPVPRLRAGSLARLRAAGAQLARVPARPCPGPRADPAGVGARRAGAAVPAASLVRAPRRRGVRPRGARRGSRPGAPGRGGGFAGPSR